MLSIKNNYLQDDSKGKVVSDGMTYRVTYWITGSWKNVFGIISSESRKPPE